MDCISGHTFFPKFIHADSVVVDLGANKGAFSRSMSEIYGCTCFAIEPNPECFGELAGWSRVKPFNLAIADREGTTSFFVAANSEASSFTQTGANDQEIQVSTVRLDDFARREGLNQIDLLKIDIEGAEVSLLDSLSDAFLTGIGQIAIEFHDFCGLVDKPDVERLVSRLETLGFRSINFSKASHGHEDHLFVNQALCPVSGVQFALTKYLIRNVMGLRRILYRHGVGRGALATT